MGQGVICRYTDGEVNREVFLHGLTWDAEPKLIAFVLGDVFPNTLEVDRLSDPSIGSFSIHFFPPWVKPEDCDVTRAQRVGHLQFISMGDLPDTGFIPEGRLK